MSELPDNHELARQCAVLEERMNTMQAEYRTDIARLAEYMARRDAERDAETARRDAEAAKRNAKRDADAARRDAEAAKRDKDNLRWQVGLWLAVVVILGIIVRWPAAAPPPVVSP